MPRLGFHVRLAGLLFLVPISLAFGADNASEPPDFKEIYDLVRTHARDVSQTELDRAAANALVAALAPRVMLVGGDSARSESGPPLAQVNLFDGDILYFRVGRVTESLAVTIRKESAAAAVTNKFTGIVLDLRSATGQDYAAAASVADLFITKDRPLLNWGTGSARSTDKLNALTMPVAVLVNHQTSGAAEALAAVLRETGVALILGARTAGQAAVTEEFPLKNGQRLRIATAPVQLADGSALSPDGVNPDITVSVSSDEEHTYYADAVRLTPGTNSFTLGNFSLTNQLNGTNRTRRPRLNEAELVRERREGVSLEPDFSGVSSDSEPEKPMIRDPALARALDLLKGLAVVRHSRS
jgi:hypothetical protein